MARLGALTEFDFDQFDLRIAGVGGEFFGIETAVVIAASEVAGTDFPDQIAAMHTVVH